ncbi:MAG TPA: hypothetical protein VMV92_29555 [Streptosporangiaceae bacterium]|nr:hypothetical protein [Streptosporangiaceae bacterium]
MNDRTPSPAASIAGAVYLMALGWMLARDDTDRKIADSVRNGYGRLVRHTAGLWREGRLEHQFGSRAQNEGTAA